MPLATKQMRLPGDSAASKDPRRFEDYSGAWIDDLQRSGSDDSDEKETTTKKACDSVAYCCLPSGCERRFADPIRVGSPRCDAVKVYCNNEACREGEWMHADCFRDWEEHVLAYLRSCSRARGWSEKQRHQNVWTKKGYDLAFKACDCRCGRGHLRQDLAYTPDADVDRKQQQRGGGRQKRKERQSSGGSASGVVGKASYGRQDLANGCGGADRVHRSSLSSSGSGSSPPSSAGTTPSAPIGVFMPARRDSRGSDFVRRDSRGSDYAPTARRDSRAAASEFFADAEQAAAGNIFRHRTDLLPFNALPRHLQNPYHIKTEDEGPHGNDETRCFLLTNLSTQKVTVVRCVACQVDLPVYDKYPLVDGTFFLSPQRYNSDLQVRLCPVQQQRGEGELIFY